MQCAKELQMYDVVFSIQLLKALRGVKIEVTHRGNNRRRYRITGLSVKPTNDLR
jgi:hypothetical protein